MWLDNPYKYKGVVVKIDGIVYLFVLFNRKLLDGIEVISDFYGDLEVYDFVLVNASFYDGSDPVKIKPPIDKFDFRDIFIKIYDISQYSIDKEIFKESTVESLIMDYPTEFASFMIKLLEMETKNNPDSNGTMFTDS